MLPARHRYSSSSPDETEIIARYGELVDRMARRLAARSGYAVAAEDLWSAGALGLLDAARRFDPSRDVRFESFAEHRIRGAMLDEMRRMDHLPRRLRGQVEEVERARGRLAQVLGHEPTVDELAQSMDLSAEELEMRLGLSLPHLRVLPEVTSHSSADSSEESVSRAELQGALARAVATLPERLQLVMSLHYEQGLTYREIGRILKVSEPRICQLHSEAIRQIRVAMDRSPALR
jgi:RNA polymerase sigma factor FliA